MDISKILYFLAAACFVLGGFQVKATVRWDLLAFALITIALFLL